MEASRRQPGMLEGLSRFLVQHERCGAGFDVAHPAGLGSGRVSITCRGCGARHEYATATIEVERELKIERRAGPEPTPPPLPPPQPEPRAPIPPRPAPYPESTRLATPRPATDEPLPSGRQVAADKRPAGGASSAAAAPIPARPAAPHPPRPAAADTAFRRFWRSPRATILLVVVAAVAVGIAVVRLVNQGGGQTQTTHGIPSQPQTTSGLPKPSAPVVQPTPTPGPKTTTVRTSRFSVDAPRGWIERTSAGGLLLEPHGAGRANVQIFFQRSPSLSEDLMARQTATFLRGEVPGARLFPRQIQIGGRSAHEVTARGPGETAIAVDVLRGPYRYLLVRRIFAGATPHVSLAASRVVLSFRPR